MSVYHYLIPMVLVGWILLRKIRRRLNDGDLIIRCRHCHTKIDTTIHSACPNCGRSYEENRYGVKKDLPYVSWEEENSEKRAEEKREKTLRRMNRLQFIGFLLALAGLISLFLKYTPGFPSFHFTTEKKEELDDRFTPASYRVIGDNVILDNEKVKVTLTGFYQQTAPGYRDEFGEENGAVKVAFQVENKSEDELHVRFRCGGVNGLMSTLGARDFIGKFEKKSTVTVYEDLYEVRGGEVKEIVYGDLQVTNYKDYDYARRDYRRYSTDSRLSYEMPALIGTLKYEGNGIRIYTGAFPGEESGESGYLLQVVNESGEDFVINVKEKEFGESIQGMHLYEMPTPNGYVMRRRLLKSRRSEERQPVFDISVSFMHLEDPSKDFSTGYFSTKP